MAGNNELTYTPELADEICHAVATCTDKLDDILKRNPHFPQSRQTVNDWRRWFPDFCIKFAQAKMEQAELMALELHEKSDECLYYYDSDGNKRVDAGSVASTKLQVETRKWIASKLVPRTYGQIAELGFEKEKNAALEKELEELRAKLNDKFEKEF